MTNKYNARKVTYYNLTFDSLAEGNRYLFLLDRVNRAEIFDLKVHPKFILIDSFTDWQGNKQRPTYYIADFEYYEYSDFGPVHVVEDVKGGKATQTAVFKLKKKLFLLRYPGIEFRIIDAVERPE